MRCAATLPFLGSFSRRVFLSLVKRDNGCNLPEYGEHEYDSRPNRSFGVASGQLLCQNFVVRDVVPRWSFPLYYALNSCNVPTWVG